MREILFRAKRIDNGEWVEGYYCKWKQIRRNLGSVKEKVVDCIITWMSDGGMSRYEIDSETLCQFTGSNDKNGNRIWENDIVSFIDMTSTESGYCERNCIGRVAWDIEEACFYVTDRLSSESWEVLQDCYAVGNIFDNPELLNGE